jgi:hypothetical protein
MVGNRFLLWLLSLVLVFGMGVYLGKSLVLSPEVVKENVLKEIDQKFLIKAKNGLLPLGVAAENFSKEVSSFNGKVLMEI